jgi:hypothetical protein
LLASLLARLAVVYLVLVLTSIMLLVGFYALTWYETGRGARLFAPHRERLDKSIGRVEFIIKHVDLKAFAREEARRLVTQAGHAVAHMSLQGVRGVERGLTRVVRHLRARHGVEVKPVGETREFVKTLSDFKDRLKDTMPEVPSVHEGE